MRRAMQIVAEVMGEIGWPTRLMDLSEAQVLTIIAVAVGRYLEAMREIAVADPEIPF
jgi:hypothetical protein